MGRGYVAGLWLVTAAISLIAGGKWIYEHSALVDDQAVLNASVVILIVTEVVAPC
jgi:hypothetical protein